MKANRKTKTIVLIILGILCTFSTILTTNLNLKYSEFNTGIDLDKENLKISAVSAPIHIDDLDPSYNWSVAKAMGICTGNGTYSEPYIIEDLVIDGTYQDMWGTIIVGFCIMIENSDAHFIIENCTLFRGSIGIKLSYVNNSQLINNSCSSNVIGIELSYSNNNSVVENYACENTVHTFEINGPGISMSYCNNNTISKNQANNNEYGIRLDHSDYNNISGNTANNNEYDGLYLYMANNNTILGNLAENSRYGIYVAYGEDNIISGNIMNNCGLLNYQSNIIDITNLVNGKPLYFYFNEVNLGVNDFLNAGQVILINCNNSIISNLDVSKSSIGILLSYCYNNTISGNIACNNQYQIYHHGIYITFSDYNTITENNVNNNYDGITIHTSNYNNVSGNNVNENMWAAIYFRFSDSNILSGNTVNNNDFGIYLSYSNHNKVSGNTLIGNMECIYEENCQGNTFSDNGDCIYGEGDEKQPIQGYNLFLLLSVLSVAVILVSKKLKKS